MASHTLDIDLRKGNVQFCCMFWIEK